MHTLSKMSWRFKPLKPFFTELDSVDSLDFFFFFLNEENGGKVCNHSELGPFMVKLSQGVFFTSWVYSSDLLMCLKYALWIFIHCPFESTDAHVLTKLVKTMLVPNLLLQKLTVIYKTFDTGALCPTFPIYVYL